MATLVLKLSLRAPASVATRPESPVGISSSDFRGRSLADEAQGAGWRNSTGTAARLLAAGLPDVASDTLSLQGSGMPPNSTCLYFQGMGKQASGPGAAFGDGLRCAAGTVVRLGTKTNNALGDSYYPTGSDARVSVKGNVPGVGGTRYCQCGYRDAAFFCTSSTFNLSNGYEVIWRR